MYEDLYVINQFENVVTSQLQGFNPNIHLHVI